MTDIKQAVKELRDALETFEPVDVGHHSDALNSLSVRVGILAFREKLPAVLDRLDELEKKVSALFPIMNGRAVPFEWIAPYESQAQSNHGQSLKRLAERGGLSPTEALCVVTGTSWRNRKPQWNDGDGATKDWESWCDEQLRNRDAERARFLELRAAVEEWTERFHDRPYASIRAILARFPVEPEAGR